MEHSAMENKQEIGVEEDSGGGAKLKGVAREDSREGDL